MVGGAYYRSGLEPRSFGGKVRREEVRCKQLAKPINQSMPVAGTSLSLWMRSRSWVLSWSTVARMLGRGDVLLETGHFRRRESLSLKQNSAEA